eukprot:29883_1
MTRPCKLHFSAAIEFWQLKFKAKNIQIERLMICRAAIRPVSRLTAPPRAAVVSVSVPELCQRQIYLLLLDHTFKLRRACSFSSNVKGRAHINGPSFGLFLRSDLGVPPLNSPSPCASCWCIFLRYAFSRALYSLSPDSAEC